MNEQPTDFQFLIEFTDQSGTRAVGVPFFNRQKFEEKSKEYFEKSNALIKYVATNINETITQLPKKPKEVEINFGINFDLEAGIMLAKAGVTSSMSVTLKWEL